MARRGEGPRLKFSERRKVWYIHFTDEKSVTRQRSTGTADRDAAEVELARFIVKEGAVQQSSDLITDILASYALAVEDEVAAPERIGFALGPLVEFCAGFHAHQIDEGFCKRYRKWRQKPQLVPAGKGGREHRIKTISDGTVRRELTTLRAAVNRSGHGAGVKFLLPKPPLPRPRWLRRSEAAALLWAGRHCNAKRHLQNFLWIGLVTGQRKEAILSLKWEQIDFETGHVNFLPEGAETTNKRRPHIKLKPKLLSQLARLKRKSNSEYVLTWGGERLLDIKRSFGDAVERAGLSSDEVTPHTLRHTRATWLMQAGVPIFEASGYLGMSPATLEKVYGHHHPDFFGKVLEAIR